MWTLEKDSEVFKVEILLFGQREIIFQDHLKVSKFDFYPVFDSYSD